MNSESHYLSRANIKRLNRWSKKKGRPAKSWQCGLPKNCPTGLEISVSVLCAVGIALVAVYFTNHDTLHRFLRRIRITRETSYPSEWYSAFSENPDCYAVLHLSGQRRLYGWPREWPSYPDRGHFIISDGEWLSDDERIPVASGSVIVVLGQAVEMIESHKPDQSIPSKV